MSDRPVTHATFVVERTYPAAPARVFAAFASIEAKRRWTACHDNQVWHELDFRVGGRERSQGGPPGGPMYRVDARYHDIVADRRIVYAYEMHRDDTRISVSVVTVELTPAGRGTALRFTEQAAFLDGRDTPAQREGGTAHVLERLGELLAHEP